MQRILWRLAAASGVAVSLAFTAGPAGAASGDSWHRPEPIAVQRADQSASTRQDTDSYAKSEQFLPINANVPIQILGFGHNGGDTKQSNNSSAWSSAENEAWTGQFVNQDQKVERPKGHDDHKDRYERPKGHDDHKDRYERPKGHDDHKDRYERPKGGPAFQWADQDAKTEQDAESHAKSKQILPLNMNVPFQKLSFGHNGGDTRQSNNSSAWSSAENEAWTGQSVDQDQKVERPKGHDDHEGYEDHKGGDDRPESGPAFQWADQDAETKQYADSSAESKQFLPVNANVPVQILSFGSNGGDTYQSNNSAAKSSAENEAGTGQEADQSQHGSGSGFQGADQDAETKQYADSSAKSEQFLPVNANVPVQILSFGHNGGDTQQSNSSAAHSSAENEAGTGQSIGQAQGLGGLLG
jgi:hypothetical protein